MGLAYLIWRSSMKKISELAILQKSVNAREFAAVKKEVDTTPKDRVKLIGKENELVLGAEKMRQQEDLMAPRGIGAR